jgi:ABC-2 type transport system ATP-binding protein
VNAIQTESLTVRFGSVVAVDALDLAVPAGEVFGFLGHNGAGKTTTVRALNGLLLPSAGRSTVLGLDPVADGSALRRRTGVLTETPALDERLTARENLTFFAAFYGIEGAGASRRVNELLDVFELTERADERVGTYSKGMKQRLALARLMLHGPDLLFLDEPTAALDPVATRHLHARIREAGNGGERTVFLCTHNLHEAELLCDRVAVLAHGRLLAVGTPSALAQRYAPATDVHIDVDPSGADVATAALTQHVGLTDVTREAGRITAPRLERDRIPDAVRAIVAAGVGVYRVEPREPTLEDVYFALQSAATSEQVS